MTEFQINCGKQQLNLGTRACIMGILNVTPDSFSDGGQFNDHDAAVAQGIRLADQGAHILDIGGESTRPFSKPVSIQQEIDRVVPVIETLTRKNLPIPISIDTVKSPVAKAALDAGAAIINDISACEMDPDMMDVAARYQVPVILMHIKGTPETMQDNPVYDDLIQEITDYLATRARHAVSRGIDKSRIILDPGIGFGKTVRHNLQLIQCLETIVDLGFPVLMGPSRKSFIRRILSEKATGTGDTAPQATPEQIETGTLAAVGTCLAHGAHIIRVHDVQRTAAFTRIFDAIRNA